MLNTVNQQIAEVLQQQFAVTHIIQVTPLSGGCINQCFCYHTNKDKYFVKYNHNVEQEHFPAEFHALKQLHQLKIVRFPEPYYYQNFTPNAGVLILEYIDLQQPTQITYELLGEQLALLHQHTSQHGFGYDKNNSIGTTLQLNKWTKEWVTFFTERRLGFQLQATEQIRRDQTIQDLGNRLLEKCPIFFSNLDIKPSLMHGDLWEGNMAADSDGSPVLFDPASYYGHQEAELGIMDMFGGYPEVFYHKYHQHWPKQDGFKQRHFLYQLYHYLNHYNIFGSGYRNACVEIINKLLVDVP